MRYKSVHFRFFNRLKTLQLYLFVVVSWMIWTLTISAQPAVNTDYQKGLEFLAKNQKRQALRSFQQAVCQDPTLANAHFSIGMLLKEKEQWLRAESALELAIKADPNYIAPYCTLAELQIKVFAQVSAAIDLFETRLHKPNQLSTDEISQLRKWLGIAYFHHSQFQKAKVELTASLSPENLDSHTSYFLGLTHIRLGNLQAAKRQFAELIEQDSFYKKAYFSLGNLYRQLGQTNESHQALQRFQEIDLEDEKIIYLEQSIRENPSQTEAWSQLGRIYAKRQQWLVASVLLKRLINLAPTNPVPHEVLCLVYIMAEQ